MKDRRPRKLKKELKKRYAKTIALKLFKCAMVTAMNASAVACISSRPTWAAAPESGEDKSSVIVDVVVGVAEKIQEIMGESPKDWREA